MITTFDPSIPAVGASGAIYGIIGSLAALRPFEIVYVFFAPMPLIVMAFIWAVISFFGIFVPSAIAHAAHLSGLLTGYALGYILKKRRGERRFGRYRIKYSF